MPDQIMRKTADPWLTRLYLCAWVTMIVITILKVFSIYVREWFFIIEHAIRPAADFIVFWTAGASEKPYDFAAVTEAQRWYTGDTGPRPFANPPSFLPWLMPFTLLPMFPAYLIWITGSASLFFATCARIVRPSYIALGLLAPGSVAVLLSGQATFLVGALTVAGMSLLCASPFSAGILFAIAATIKPQSVIFIPLALIAGRHWHAMGATIVAGLAIGIVCVSIQGAALWLEWVQALPRFDTLVRQIGMAELGITPTAAILDNGLAGWRTIIVNGGATLGLVTIWIVFRRSEDVATRLLALVCGTLLILPYAMSYELAVVAPFAAAMLFNRNAHPLAWLAGFMVLTTTGMALALAVMCLTLLWFQLGGTPIREIPKS